MLSETLEGEGVEMRRVTYNKLVRDRIPEIIAAAR